MARETVGILGVLFWVLVFLAAAALVFLTVFYLISFTDLESDYVNPIDLCRRLNVFVLPEYAGHLGLTLMLLLAGQWVPVVCNLPLVAWHASRFMAKKHLFDNTGIFQNLAWLKKEATIKLGLHVVFLFYYLYKMIVALVIFFVGPRARLNLW